MENKREDIKIKIVLDLRPFSEAMQKTLSEIGTALTEHLFLAAKVLGETIKKWDEDRREWFRLLSENGWIVTSDMSIWVDEHENLECNTFQEKLLQLFSQLFDSESFRFLDQRLEAWLKNPVLRKREHILRDCVEVYKMTSDKKNYYTLIVPTLLSQIDGIRHDCLEKLADQDLELKGILEKLEVQGDVREQSKLNQIIKKYIEQSHWNKFGEGMHAKLINDTLYERLLYKQKPDAFSRHKILHGENVNYAKKEYVLKLFLTIDFLNDFLEDIAKG